MKRIIVYIVISLTLTCKLVAGELDSLSVRDIVQAQIAEAKAKQSKVVQPESKTIEVQQVNNVTKASIEGGSFEVNPIVYKIMILLFFSTGIAAFVYYKRKKNADILKKIELKKNIQMMRQEKFIKRIDPRLKQIRTSLCLNSSLLNGKPAVTNTAKKLQIGHEELFLASRIKQYENKIGYNRRAV